MVAAISPAQKVAVRLRYRGGEVFAGVPLPGEMTGAASSGSKDVDRAALLVSS
jgi:hypothetical protein